MKEPFCIRTQDASFHHSEVFTHVAAAALGAVAAVDTHWIWQDGRRLTRELHRIIDDAIEGPSPHGLGVEPDFERVEHAHPLYRRIGVVVRDDSTAMQFLSPGWRFDPKCPCLMN